MRRAQIILVIVGLMATPLALLARGVWCDNSPCMCSMMHGQHPTICHCPMESGHHPLDFGFVAPMAPTYAMAIGKLSVPVSARLDLTSYKQSALSLFPSEPF